VKTENPSACIMVNCMKCGNSGSALLPVVPSCVNKVSINPIIQSKTPSVVTDTRGNILYCHVFGVCVTNNNGFWI
jgi:hypothetical protein